MKKLLVALFALGTLTANAQTFKDTSIKAVGFPCLEV